VLENLCAVHAQMDPTTARYALARFLFTGDAVLQPVRTLSGGERLRLSLACAFAGDRPPALLVLDEPTNHLDDAATEFLETHLAGLPGAIVFASHDRVFLDAVCTDIVDLDPALGGATRYGGTYTDYLAAKAVEQARWEQRYAKEQDELAHLRHAVAVTARQVSHHRSRGNTSKLAYDYSGNRVQKQVSRRVRNARQRLTELAESQVRKPPEPLRFTGAASAHRGHPSPQVASRGPRGGTWCPAPHKGPSRNVAAPHLLDRSVTLTPDRVPEAVPDTRGERLRLVLVLGAFIALGPLTIDLYLPALPTSLTSSSPPTPRCS
jgi:ATPase subunit of ABC transporter with duplicated ATPase domains